MSWWERIVRRRHLYNDLSEEVREHIEEKIEQLMRLENLPRTEARQAALRAFGNPGLVEQRSRDVWQWPKLESLFAGLKLAFRRLTRSPGFAVTVLLTLAIGIGANTAVFTVVDSILLKPLPYPQPEQLVAVWLHAPGVAGLTNFAEGSRLSPSMYLTFAEHNRTFRSIGVWVSGTANVTGTAQPEEIHSTYISDGVLQTLNVPPAAGRWILADEQVPRGRKVAMLSFGYWQRRFGGDLSVIGRTIQVDSQTREIVGIMPRGFEAENQDFDLLIPLAFDPQKQILAGFGYNGIARLKPGVTISQADADIAHMLNIWMDSWTNNDGGNPHFYETWKISGAIRPMKQEVIGNVGSVLWMVMGTIGVVMLIACTNVANLLLVRVEGRQQELAIRAALGAGKARIAAEVLSECVLLALIGGSAGIGVAEAGLRLLTAIDPGFTDANHVQTLRVAIPQQLIADASATTRVESSIADALCAIPGVNSVGFARAVPMDGSDPDWDNIFIEGKNEQPGSVPMRLFNNVSPGYFRTTGTRLVAGRDFTWTDIYGLRPVGIVSENLARESWGSAAAAIGKQFRITPTQPWQEVIGVAEDVRQNGVDETAPAIVYWAAMKPNPFTAGEINSTRAVAFVMHTSRAGTESLRSEI